jgi:hypothetical protein
VAPLPVREALRDARPERDVSRLLTSHHADWLRARYQFHLAAEWRKLVRGANSFPWERIHFEYTDAGLV